MLIRNFLKKAYGGLLYLNGFEFEGVKPKFDVFVQDLIDKHVNDYHTHFCKNNNRQCDARRNRSLGELYLICKFYYPKCTLWQLKTILIKLYKQEKIWTRECCTIHKRTYYTIIPTAAYGNYGEHGEFDKWLDEFGMTIENTNFDRHIKKLKRAKEPRITKKQRLATLAQVTGRNIISSSPTQVPVNTGMAQQAINQN